VEDGSTRPEKTRAPGLPSIRHYFSEYFAPWGIVLPAAGVIGRCRGEIRHHGWCIQYVFGRDERGEYPAYSDKMFFPVGATESEQRRIMAETSRHDNEVAALLETKGFSRVMFPGAWEWRK
jgi:hypothetical protein